MITGRSLPRHSDPGSSCVPGRKSLLLRAAPQGTPSRARRPLGPSPDGELPDFLPETREIRESSWTVAPIPPPLLYCRVEITGPVDRKMIINALNSGASMFMADLEDSNSPTWDNNLQGHANLRDAVDATIDLRQSRREQIPPQSQNPAVLFVRPRGWHLDEKHMLVSGEPISASLFDFGLFFFHNAAALVNRGWGPLSSISQRWRAISKRDSVERRLQFRAGLYSEMPRGTIRATVLIDTILGAFEMDEILYELARPFFRPQLRPLGLHFQLHQEARTPSDKMLPDRSRVTMDKAFLKAYVDLLIQTCHKREIHAMGGMAAQVPIKNNPKANAQALGKSPPGQAARSTRRPRWHVGGPPRSCSDSQRRLRRAHEDAQPDSRQTRRRPDHCKGSARARHRRHHLRRFALQRGHRNPVPQAWLNGTGCVPIYNLMEDAATAEISRSQVWQRVRHNVKLSDGRTVTPDLVRQAIDDEPAAHPGTPNKKLAASLFADMMTRSDFQEFLTTAAHQHID